MAPPKDEELSAQLEITKQLTDAITQMTAALDARRESFSKQKDAVEELSDAFDVLAEQHEKVDEEQAELEKKLKQQIKNIKSFKDLGGVAQTMLDKFAKSSTSAGLAVGTMTTAFKGAQAAFKSFKALSGGLLDAFSSITSAILEIGAAIISLPFKMLNGLIGMAKDAYSGGNELARVWEKVRAVFGDTKSGLGKTVGTMGQTLFSGMITGGLQGARIFGTVAEAMEHALDFASKMPVAFEKIQDQFSGGGALKILAMAKGLGIDNEELAKLQSRAIATGESLEGLEVEITKYSKGMSQQFGLNSKLMSRDMAKSMNDVKHFANATVKEIAEATAYSHKLGLELHQITGILDAFNTFDQAAENVSKLSQAFGVNIDTMKLVQAKTPADALAMVKDSFNAAGKSVENMNRQELQLLGASVGLTEEQVKQGLSSKNQGIALDKAKSSSQSLEAQTLSTAQALQKLSKDMERVIKDAQPPKGDNFLDIFVEGFFEGISMTQDFRKLLREIFQDMLVVRQAGRDLGKMFVDTFPGFKEFLSGLVDILSPDKIGGLFRGFTKSFGEFFKDLEKGTATVEGLFKSLQNNFTEYLTESGEGGRKVLTGAKKMWDAFKQIIATGITWISDMLVDGLKLISQFLSGDFNKALGDAGKVVNKELEPIKDAFLKAWDKLSGPLEEVLTKMFNKAIDALLKLAWENKGSILIYAMFTSLPSILSSLVVQAFTSNTVKNALTDLAKRIPVPGGAPPAAAGGAASAVPGILSRASSVAIGGAGAAAEGGGLAALGGGSLAAGAGIAAAGVGAAALAGFATGKFIAGQLGWTEDSVNEANEIRNKFITDFEKRSSDTITSAQAAIAAAGPKTGKDSLEGGYGALLANMRQADQEFMQEADSYVNINDDKLEKIQAKKFKFLQAALNVTTDPKQMSELLRSSDAAIEDLTKKTHVSKQAVLDKMKELNANESAAYIATAEELENKGYSDAEKAMYFALKNEQNIVNKQKEVNAQIEDMRKKGMSPESITKAATEAKTAAEQKAAGEAQMQKTIAEIGETNINNAKERFAKIDELSKKILGPDFKLDETMKNIREKLGGINFSIFSTSEIENNFKTGIGQMNEALTMFFSLGKIASTMNEVAANVKKIGNKDKGPIKDLTDGIGTVFDAMVVMNSAISKKVAALSTSGGNNQIQTSLGTQLAELDAVSKGIKDVTTALSAIATTPAAAVKSGIQNMVESMKTLNKGLDEMEKDAALGKIDLRLGRIANSLGIKDAQYTFAHAPVTITMRINVTMDAHELEKVVVNADNSIIRTALNEVAGQPATASVTRTGKPDGSLLVKPAAA